MDSLIRIINDLHGAFTELQRSGVSDARLARDFQQLPQIAVVGSQSSGKSSVLESFVGRDFLPRGSGIVTRRPLILQLVRQDHPAGSPNNSEPNDFSGEYGVFGHAPERYVSDFEAIRAEISRETDRVAGSGKVVSSVPISLKIYSPRVVDLTLIDLPGLTRVPVGDQPQDIAGQIEALVRRFVESDNCLILAVSAANADLANSDALKLAREVDPEGLRTIGVLTKLDLMDHGTDSRAALDNKIYPLRYGYVGVVNRSQKDIDQHKDLSSSLEAERRFFLAHPAYRDIEGRLGTLHLRKLLHAHLVSHIAASLPGLRAKLSEQIVGLEKSLGAMQLFSGFDPGDPNWKLQALVLKLVQFAQAFQNEVLGNYELGRSSAFFAGSQSAEFSAIGAELSTGSRIRHLFHATYPLELCGVQFTDESTVKREIAIAIQNIAGVRVQIFTPDQAFSFVIREQISRMQEPIFALLERVAEQLLSGLHLAAERSLGASFPELSRFLEHYCHGHIALRVEQTRAEILTLLECERAYINAKHEDFIGFRFENHTSAASIRNLRKDPSRQVVHKGWLSVSAGSPGGQSSFLPKMKSPRFWFVLTCDSLSWYQDDSEAQREYTVGIDEQIKRIDRTGQDRAIFLIDKQRRNVWKGSAALELLARSAEEMDEWKVKLLNVGVYPAPSMEAAQAASHSSDQDFNAHLRKQSEEVWKLVHSYLKIVRSNLCDMVPKVIAHSLINHSVRHFQTRLIAESQSGGVERLERLMAEDPGQAAKRAALQKMVVSCRLVLERLETCHVPEESATIVAKRQSRPVPRPSSVPYASAVTKSHDSKVPQTRPKPPAVPAKPGAKGERTPVRKSASEARISTSGEKQSPPSDETALRRQNNASVKRLWKKIEQPGQNMSSFYTE